MTRAITEVAIEPNTRAKAPKCFALGFQSLLKTKLKIPCCWKTVVDSLASFPKK